MNNKRSNYFLVMTVFLTAAINLSGQIPVIAPPKPASPFTIPDYNNPTPQVKPINPNPIAPNPGNPMEMVERDMRELKQRNAELYKMLHEYEDFMANRSTPYDLPSLLGIPGTEYYQNALDELSKMLRGEVPLNLKDAVFTVENAYFENRLDYSKFNKAINELSEIARLKTMQDKYNWNHPLTKNIMLFRVMADTLEIKSPQRETSIVSYPMQYDFEDSFGEEDWASMFVSKLLATRFGQCHSLPLLYLILCEETGAEACLAYSPMHSYIKIKDDSGDWHNLELTNGTIASEAYVIGSGYITSEAVKHGTYLQAQRKEQVIAQCVSDLAMGYIQKYGYDSFVKQCTDSVFKYDANNLAGLMIDANYATQRFAYAIYRAGLPPLDSLKTHYPKIHELLDDRNAAYTRLDAIGYCEFPKEEYKAWLNAFNEEKARREHNEKYNKMLRLMR